MSSSDPREVGGTLLLQTDQGGTSALLLLPQRLYMVQNCRALLLPAGDLLLVLLRGHLVAILELVDLAIQLGHDAVPREKR
jgi:hypothetical protein